MGRAEDDGAALHSLISSPAVQSSRWRTDRVKELGAAAQLERRWVPTCSAATICIKLALCVVSSRVWLCDTSSPTEYCLISVSLSSAEELAGSKGSTTAAGRTSLQAAQEDELFCASVGRIASQFCRQDLPDQRAAIAQLTFSRRSRCKYGEPFESIGPSVDWRSFGAGERRPWSARSPFTTQEESLFERSSEYSKEYPLAQTAMTDLVAAENEKVYVDHCEVQGSEAEASSAPLPLEQHAAVGASAFTVWWTFERVGPFIGHGAEWHSAGWLDAGRFGGRIKAGVWVTASGFFPMTASGAPLGLPPIHLHHMHVTSSQAYYWDPKGMKRSSDGSFAVEFDLHGDRQCSAAMGGMNCTIRAFPRGYGMRLTDSMETFFDLKDVRPAGSSTLHFYAQHVYRWTTVAPRLVGKFMTGISTLSFKPHDDFILVFDPARRTEYLYWMEGTFTANATMVHMYWHAHHKYAEDMWVL